MNILKINVTKDDIKNGDLSGFTCPMALACRRAIPKCHPRAIYVGKNQILFRSTFICEKVDLSLESQLWIIGWETAELSDVEAVEIIEPISFEIKHDKV